MENFLRMRVIKYAAQKVAKSVPEGAQNSTQQKP